MRIDISSEKEGETNMKNPGIFFGAIIVAIVCFLIGIYYALPGVNHILVSGKTPPMEPQPTHILLFMGLAVLCVIAALVTRPKANR
jgi:CDP-diglyceride synthetase